jgi:hypothetical protein
MIKKNFRQILAEIRQIKNLADFRQKLADLGRNLADLGRILADGKLKDQNEEEKIP